MIPVREDSEVVIIYPDLLIWRSKHETMVFFQSVGEK
jgi:hypothetical protein